MKKLFTSLLFFHVAIIASLAQNVPNGVKNPAAAAPKSTASYYYPETSPNYLRTLVPVMPTQDTGRVTMNAVVDSVNVFTRYFDPLGRPYETIAKQSSPSKKDVVQVSVYDEFSRENTTYLPYAAQTGNYNDGLFKSMAVKDDSAFYKSMFPNESIYYSQLTDDNSPLLRMRKATAPGNSWTGANIGTSYATRANTVSDSVRLWTIATTGEDDIPTTTSICQAGTLVVDQVTDERGIKILSYIDGQGRTVLEKKQLAASPGTGHSGWLCTYYIYDEIGNLRMVIPSKAVEALNNATVNWSLTYDATINQNLCYAYYYDAYERVIMRRIPGKGKVYTVYDLYNRIVMTQDANQRANNQWFFILYDGRDRPDTTGLITTTLIKDSVIAQASRSARYPTLTGTYSFNTAVFYDDYNWVGTTGCPLSASLSSTDINSNNFITSYNTGPYYAQPLNQGLKLRGLVTGTKTLIVNSTTWLWGLNIYDTYGRPIQTTQTNYTGGTDIATMQYSFVGDILRKHLAHQKSGTNPQTHKLLTKYTYDHVGRIKSVSKNIDNLGDKTISQFSYNELGQLSSKVLGNSIETQNYAYNIRGWITGIDTAYVNSPGSTSNYFGEVVSYDYGFTTSQVNGNIAGVRWKAAGDGIARAYGFLYDNTNRLTTADFNQQNQGSTSWTKDKVDFSTTGLTYDAGGNIIAMKQRGQLDGTPATIDSLTYQYFTNSNQLQKITEGATVGGMMGDFKDTTYAGNDYVYDGNGNVIKDYNKRIVTAANGNGIVYNYLNKADSLVIMGKAGIHYYYDAGGVQLRKQVNDYTSGALISKNYLYINGFVYLNDTLQYVKQEEGQIRYARKTNSSTGAVYYAYEYDYYLRDHQGNVRTVLTEGRDTSTYAATMESADSVVVAATFSNVYSPVNTVNYGKPAGFDTDPNNHNVALLNASTSVNKKVGPSIVLKVMAGDKVQLSAYSFYSDPVQAPAGGTNLLTDILGVLGNGIVGSSGGKFPATEVSTINNAVNPDVSQFLSSGRPYDNTRPKAYLNWILFDNQFNYVAASSNAVQVTAGSSKQPLVPSLQTMAQNGYLYVYVSNESPQNVYFDNITVKHYTGPLQQEQSYYPFGLPQAGISDRALLKKMTPYKGDGGVELEEDFALSYYNTGFRKYDPQTGRFNGVDDLSDETFDLSPYEFSGNNPIYYNDPSGLSMSMPDLNYWQGATGPLADVIVTAVAKSSGGGGYTMGSWWGILDGSLNGGFYGSFGGGGGGAGGSAGTGSGGFGGFGGGGFGGGYCGGGGGIHAGGGGAAGIYGGGGSAGASNPPIFWEEEGNPEVEVADFKYSQLALAAGIPGRVLRNVPGYPFLRFLVFHYKGPDFFKTNDQNRDFVFGSNSGNLADRIKKQFLMERHEVPYASTTEGGGAGFTFPVHYNQNRTHGALLKEFYIRNGFKGGEEFWVPLPDFLDFDPLKVPITKKITIPERKKQDDPTFLPVLVPAMIETAEGAEAAEALWLLLFLL